MNNKFDDSEKFRKLIQVAEPLPDIRFRVGCFLGNTIILL